MASNRTVYHVAPNSRGDNWLITQEGNDSSRQEFRTKAEAALAAKLRARMQEPSQVKFHGSDGNTEYESTYGEGSARTPS